MDSTESQRALDDISGDQVHLTGPMPEDISEELASEMRLDGALTIVRFTAQARREGMHAEHARAALALAAQLAALAIDNVLQSAH